MRKYLPVVLPAIILVAMFVVVMATEPFAAQTLSSPQSSIPVAS